ncbi:unnamed protein product [Psylliodes chrysocephalus]|uniref:Uncharacterized protein n=1 Tax=Psylliodes chrysocephalus TaxID=3402493 RepID=A0A9P0G3Y4_9CUCU|nr:unnamed protein product [Psylliodes chrysocephala]
MDDTEGKGNFLELVLLLAKYDDILKHHVDMAAKDALSRKEKYKDIHGRGNLITFFGKTTINTIITIIGNEIKLRVANEVKKLEIIVFKLIQPRMVIEQCSSIVRE